MGFDTVESPPVENVYHPSFGTIGITFAINELAALRFFELLFTVSTLAPSGKNLFLALEPVQDVAAPIIKTSPLKASVLLVSPLFSHS